MASGEICVGSAVWVEHGSSGYAAAEVVAVAVADGEAQVRTSDGSTINVKMEKLYLRDTGNTCKGVDNMTELLYLHEPGVLQNVADRYHEKEYFTKLGDVLFLVNPTEMPQHLYDKKTMDRYIGKYPGELSPHVFAVAEAAYRSMMSERKDQTIVVSGLSGSGRSKMAMLLFEYFVYRGSQPGNYSRTVKIFKDSVPVLIEAFTSAKVAQNSNSSRAGKFMKLHFDEHGRISGAAIKMYLLERCRVCKLNENERNYHCFYYLCAAPEEVTEMYELKHPGSYQYLCQSHCLKATGINDSKRYTELVEAMNAVGITDEEKVGIFKVLALILHLGNIRFGKKKDSDSAEVEDDNSRDNMKIVAKLLMCDCGKLEAALTTHKIKVSREEVEKPYNPNAAAASRDGLAKALYFGLLKWIIAKINSVLGQANGPASSSVENLNSKHSIGVLEVCGFQHWEHNGFEQLCINYTNEKLHWLFIQHEQKLYREEHINCNHIQFINHNDALDLIENAGGIYSILDDSCKIKGSEFAQELQNKLGNRKGFVKSKTSPDDIVLSHYAGDVNYSTSTFVEKNNDYVVEEHRDLLKSSKCPFILELLPHIDEDACTAGSSFKRQVRALMNAIAPSEPHFIRCVRPNSHLKPEFNNSVVLQQLRAASVQEAIRLSCTGHPTRMPFSEFARRYVVLAPEIIANRIEDHKEACLKIFQKMELKKFHMGKTKVFFGAGHLRSLENRRSEVAATRIQKESRMHIAHKKYVDLRKSAIYLQSICRATIACKMCASRQPAALKIQKNFRCYSVRRMYLKIRAAAITFQKRWKARFARKEKVLNEQDTLAECFPKDLRLPGGQVADCTFYKCLQRMRFWEDGKPDIFDQFIEKIRAIVKDQDCNEVLVSWLSNICNVLMYIEQSAFLTDSAACYPCHNVGSTANLFERIHLGTKQFSGSSGRPFLGRLPNGGLRDLIFIEEIYPAILFKQKAAALLFAIYTALRNNLKEEISNLLQLCIQVQSNQYVPETYYATLADRQCFHSAGLVHRTLDVPWKLITKLLDHTLDILKVNYVPPLIIQKIFQQIFSFINVCVLNSLLRGGECSSSIGTNIRLGLDNLESWCYKASEEYVGFSKNELAPLKQVVALMRIEKKHKMAFKEITDKFYPLLSMQQLYRLCTLYWDESYGANYFPLDVILNMRGKMKQELEDASSRKAFFLEEDQSIPFSVAELCSSMPENALPNFISQDHPGNPFPFPSIGSQRRN